MDTLDHAGSRLGTFLDEIKRLKDSEFPYPHSSKALELLESLVKEKIARLKQIDPAATVNIIHQECALALSVIPKYLSILGFILRSTNVRNAFEIYGPILRLARQVLEPTVDPAQRKTKLLLSSEWRYSPFIFTEISDLKDFVLIGFPAHESANPLLIPLAGHELGHRLWARKQHQNSLKLPIVKWIQQYIQTNWSNHKNAFPWLTIPPGGIATNLLAYQTYYKAVEWALKQAEETYCDFVGLWLFGPSYLHAFSYLLSPSIGNVRALYYPNFKERAANLLTASSAYNIVTPPNYVERFENLTIPKLPTSDSYQSDLADGTLSNFISDLIALADSDLLAASVKKPSPTEALRILKRFELVVPPEKVISVADLVNAGWDAYESQSFWGADTDLKSRKASVLKELILKGIEIFEIEEIVKEN